MRRAVVVAIDVVAVAVGMVSGLIVAGSLPSDAIAWIFATIFALLLLPLVPAVTVTLVATWLVDPTTHHGRTILRRVLAVLGGVQLVSAVLLLAAVALYGLEPLLPIAVVLVCALATVVAVRVGERVRIRSAERATPDEWRPFTRAETVRAWRGVAAVFLVAFVVVGTALATIFGLTGEDLGVTLTQAGSLAAASASYAAALVILRVTWPAMSAMGDVFGTDTEAQGRVTRAVTRAKPVALDARERTMAERYVPIVEQQQPFQLAMALLLFAGLFFNQLGYVIDDTDVGGPAMILVVLAPVLAIVVIVFVSRQLANVRRYRREQLGPSTSSGTGAGPSTGSGTGGGSGSVTGAR
jgi:hypothetical protein